MLEVCLRISILTKSVANSRINGEKACTARKPRGYPYWVMFQLQDVNYGFDSTSHGAREELFTELNLKVTEGETLVVVGPSGVGKSVILKMMVGLVRPDAGRVCFQGKEVSELSFTERLEFLHKVGMTFQKSALFDSLNCAQNLRFPLKERTNFSKKQIEKRVDIALEEVGLSGTKRLRTHELSGGMQKRLGIARALVLSPTVMLYDDPTAGLDPITSRSIINLIAQMKQKHAMTVVLVTSDVALARQTGDRMGFLYGGKFLFTGSHAQMLESDHPVVSQFVHGRIHGPLTDELGGEKP